MVIPTITKGQQLPDSLKQKEEKLNDLITKKNKTWVCFILNNPSTDQWEIVSSYPASPGEASMTLVAHGFTPYTQVQTIEKGVNKIYVATPANADTFSYFAKIENMRYDFKFKKNGGKWIEF